MKFNHFVRRIKDFVKRHRMLYEIIYTMIFFVWSIERVIRAKLIFQKVNPSLAKKNDFKVVILALRTFPAANLTYFDAVFGQAFKRLGCDVKMLYCDGVLDSCDADTVFRNQKPQCFICKRFSSCLKKSLNLDCVSFHQYISNSDIEEIKQKVAGLNDKELLDYEYLGINVGEQAYTSAIRYFLFGRIDLNDSKEVSILRKKLVYTMIATKVAENVVVKEKPNCIFMLHGIYSSWGPFLSYSRLKGIDTIVYNNAFSRIGCFIFNRNSNVNELISKKEWANFVHLPLKDEEGSQIDNYFTKRFKGEVDDQKMYRSNFDTKVKGQAILELLSKKKYSRRYVMYPNIPWDGAIKKSTSGKIFDDVFSWVDTNIEFFKNKKDYQLIIKPHPAELVEKVKKEIADYIIEKHSPLPENITLFKPNVPLSAYDLTTPDTVCLVFNGSLGAEFAAAGIPVLVAADVHYRDAGVVYKVKKLEEYLKLLEDPSELIQFAKNNVELAKKYAYFYFFKSTIRIPFYRDDKWAEIDWQSMADMEKLLAEGSNVTKICQRIINREDIVAPL